MTIKHDMNSGDVFINCPFSEDYQDFFKAIVFTVIRCGFTPRCAREEDDGGDNRLDKICRIIPTAITNDRWYKPFLELRCRMARANVRGGRSPLPTAHKSNLSAVGIISECRYGIHDISKTELDDDSGLPRFNMPLELGIFLGAKKFGEVPQNQKRTLILDRAAYRYQQYISDIAGQDIHSHNQDVIRLISEISAWLRTASRRTKIPGGQKIADDYERFNGALPSLADYRQLEQDELTYSDMVGLMTSWLADNEA